MVKILAFSGSARKGSYNQKLVTFAAKAAETAGAEVRLINLADFPMPIFNEDLEKAEGLPVAAKQFKQLLIEHQGFLIASPEYNSAFSPLLKNALDWASRKETSNEAPLIAYRGKVAAIMAASPGTLGGLRGLVFLRLVLSNLGVNVLANQQAVNNAATVFDEQGNLSDQTVAGNIKSLSSDLTCLLQKLHQNN